MKQTNLFLSMCEHVRHDAKIRTINQIDSLPVLQCDIKTDGGGWIVIQRRTSDAVDFFRDWNDYKSGFGNASNFWLGNDAIHELTKAGDAELRVDMVLQGKSFHASYSRFQVGDEATNYRLAVSGYSGDAGDSLAYHDGRAFSTQDRDNDDWPGHCASLHKGGWWYRYCYRSLLNGPYHKAFWAKLSWLQSLDSVEMKIRPRR